jgi:hypothetical protein
VRLIEQQRATLKEETAAAFGPQAQLRLCGSRVDGNIKGGDIDIHIEADGSEKQLLQNELRLRMRLQASGPKRPWTTLTVWSGWN